MKKMIALSLAGIMSISMLTGCSSKDSEDDKKEETPKVADKESTKKKEETTTNKTEKETTNNTTTLSSNWLDNQIQIKGKVLTLPIDFKELSALGFDFEDMGEYVVNPKEGAYGKSVVDADGNKFSGIYANYSDSAVDIRETQLSEITVLKDDRMEGNKNFDIILAGGLEFACSVEQAKAVYGEPTSDNTYDVSTTLTYRESDANYGHSLVLNFYKDKLISATLSL